LSTEELSRSALRVYVKLVESGKPLGVRELARELELPVSTVYYSLKRLEELDLVRRSGDGYAVRRVVSPEGFLVVRRKLIPRLLVYSAFFVGVVVGELALTATSGPNPDRVVAVVVSLAASLVLLFEGLAAKRRYS